MPLYFSLSLPLSFLAVPSHTVPARSIYGYTMHAKWSSWVFQAPARILPAADRQQQPVFLFLPSVVRVLYSLYGTWLSTGASSNMEARASIYFLARKEDVLHKR